MQLLWDVERCHFGCINIQMLKTNVSEIQILLRRLCDATTSRTEQCELSPSTEPDLNSTLQVSVSGLEGKLDLLWLSFSPASS